jgi:hypothetical protein
VISGLFFGPVAGGSVGVSVSPGGPISLGQSQSQQFTATVTGTSNTAVNWSISPVVGTVSGSGLYSAPASIAAAQSVTVKATSVADASKSASAVVNLTPPVVQPDFAVSFNTSINLNPLSVNPGNQNAVPMAISSVGGFAGPVTLTVTGLPSNYFALSASYFPNGTGNPILYVLVPTGAPPAQYTVRVTGTSGSLNHSVQFTVQVSGSGPYFSVSATPSSQSINAGANASYNVAVSAFSGFSGAVSLGVTGFPTGSGVSFNPSSISTSGSSTLNVTVPGNASAGTYTLTVTGTSGVSHSAQATLVVGGGGGGGQVTVSTTSPPKPTAPVAYSQPLNASGGSQPYSWSLTSGSLPSGLTLSSGGMLSGTPSATGTFTFTVRAVDTAGQSGTATLTVTVLGPAATLADFQSCLSGNMPYDTAATCALQPNPLDPFGRYAVTTATNPLRIGRSGFVITGIEGPYGYPVLYRADNPSGESDIMIGGTGVTGVTIQNLTFDGNRYGFLGAGPSKDLSCMGLNNYYDLHLHAGGTFTVQWVDFINAPGTALFMSGYGSSVSFSNFGQGGYGVGPSGPIGVVLESAPQSATRTTAVWLSGSNNGAWYNAIAYAGTAAINLNGSTQTFYGNLLYQNRYELSDGSTGGSVFLDPGSSNAFVAGNVINGNLWFTRANDKTPLATGCLGPQGADQFPGGVEVYGYGHGFYNNEIEQHRGSGIGGAGSENTGRITISSQNPSDPSDTPRYIEMNAFNGIQFLGFDNFGNPACGNTGWLDQDNVCHPVRPVVGVTLYNINVRNNAPFDVDLDSVSNDSTVGFYGPYNGFLNSSCIIVHLDPNGYLGPIAGVNASTATEVSLPPYGNGVYNNTLSNPIPSNAASGYGVLITNGGTCPDPGWPAQTPAPSHNPSWHW